jgi:hypothetical protein
MAGKDERVRRGEKGIRGERGARGKRGARGPQGPPGVLNGELAKMADQMERVVEELHTQLMRIAQMQAQIDRMAAGAAPPAERRKAPRTKDSTNLEPS